MTTPVPEDNTIASTPEYSGVEFGVSADGFPVARIGDIALAMVPLKEGGGFLASGWNLRRPLCELTRADFYGHEGRLADEAAFRARVLETAEHRRELARLNRVQARISCSTPWGASQIATIYAEGVVSHSTASHGGFHLSVDRNVEVHPMLRSSDGFYEEDCCWAAVAIAFPNLFTAYERRVAKKTLKDGEPDAWEAIFGQVLAPGESHARDLKAFELAHANEWVVVSALRSDHHPGMTEVIATCGGKRDPHAGERRFLVASTDYQVGRFGFVIDETRHAAYDGPSSFVSWSGRNAA
ncbi:MULTISPECIES: hypothetical protein [Rhizobium/Agrobacterium group]|jgi:hypothetical protein|uniref:DUF7007 domain-containing protein n=1 Tax=unclassified Rhizobium TaxID=2613769 RepID=UPI000DB68815|nr:MULTISPECIES: hypothetical protein [Rhizobium/Agrobacterium group]KAB2694109.1 hypothetical protein F9K79_20365 [Ochrobactrum sp. Kaboul]PZU71394.1 MAG: hypothetical protein DI546_16195 [Rhizobium sp.]HCJ73598.1 hypothetical protein [Agrobacterium sp.]TQN59242.1 hypothetical protein FLX27_22980 [Agrobacterium tumefaciens]CAD7038147.1 hypothetical protein RP007_04656 [Rhizobium sp. P007]